MNMKQVKPYVRESSEPTDMLSQDEFIRPDYDVGAV